jgi:hypothetical protein
MKLLEKEVFIPPKDGRSVFPGPVSYYHPDKPHLMMWYGYIDHSDAYDDYVEIISKDNGRTWSEPESRFKGKSVPEGRIRYAEPVFFYDPDQHVFVSIMKKGFYPGDKRVQSIIWELEIRTYDFDNNLWSEAETTKLGFPEGIATSFSFPINLKTGKILVPIQKGMYDPEKNKFIHYNDYWSRAYQSLAMIGEYTDSGKIDWHAGKPNPASLDQSCRGQCEPAFTDLIDGRVAAVCRGDNGAYPEKPGYKWIIISEDQGETWSEPVPFGCTDGSIIESPSSGSALFRSIKNGNLYWIGNLCILGERPNGNWPRNPLVISEVDEKMPALKRDSITIIDNKKPDDGFKTQLSNFKYYQDRETGDIILFLTRFGENGTKNNPVGLSKSNFYRYKITV